MQGWLICGRSIKLLGFMFMNELFMKCIRGAYRITIAMIPLVADRFNARVRNKRLRA